VGKECFAPAARFWSGGRFLVVLGGMAGGVKGLARFETAMGVGMAGVRGGAGPGKEIAMGGGMAGGVKGLAR